MREARPAAAAMLSQEGERSRLGLLYSWTKEKGAAVVRLDQGGIELGLRLGIIRIYTHIIHVYTWTWLSTWFTVHVYKQQAGLMLHHVHAQDS
jgi:hypothetical protein